jgi:capsular polysaccharide biosynthesis protein
MKIIKFKQQVNFVKNVYPEENLREINLYKYNNCILTGINIYYPNVLIYENNNNLILPVIEKTMSLKMSSIYEVNNMEYELQVTSNMLNKIDNPVFFFIYNTDNYFHFLYDSLPYLISFLQLKESLNNLKLLVQYPNQQKLAFYPFVTEFLNILGINENDIVLANDSTIYKEIYISNSYTHDTDSNLPPRKEIYDFYQKIVKIVKSKNDIKYTPTKIYVSRRSWLHNNFSNIGTNYTTRRKCVNENELVEKLQKEGFIELFTENLTTIEKILYFSKATHVVGAIGGGISNVLFSPNNTKLEVIVSPTFLDVNLRFKYSLDCVNVYYNYNTEHYEKTDFKTFMRVKTKDNRIIGEIDKLYDNKLLVSYTNEFNVGWNFENKYEKIELNLNEVEKIDNGLNSPWVILNFMNPSQL